MKTFKTIALILLGALTITGCKNNPKEQHDTEKTVSTETIVEKKQEEPTPEPTITNTENEISFHKTLTLQNITFDIKTTGKGSIRQLSIEPKGLEINNDKVVHEIEGEVVDAEIEDLNSDGYPEILVYTVSAGSGSYGNVIGYSVNNGKSMSQISFPNLSENKEANTGYMGHDKFAIVETSLVRKFPVYNEKDTNNTPTGGARRVQYKLKNGENSRKFVVHKVFPY